MHALQLQHVWLQQRGHDGGGLLRSTVDHRTSTTAQLDYEGMVTPRLRDVRMTCYRGLSQSSDVVRGRIPRRRNENVEVYLRLKRELFDYIFDCLPCSDFIINHPSHENDEPRVWLLGCYDAVLLRRCAQWITRASINIDPAVKVPQRWETACLKYNLGLMRGVTQLSLTWPRNQLSTYPKLSTDLTDMLPRHTSLAISRLPLSVPFMLALMDGARLQQLRLDKTRLGSFTPVRQRAGPNNPTHTHLLCFSCPAQWPDVVQMSRETTGDEKAKRAANRRLRLALSAHWKKALADCGRDTRVIRMRRRCEDVQKQLEAEKSGQA